MSRSIHALVNSEMLRWARESIGMGAVTAAVRLAVSESRLLAWEAGAADLTVAQLRRIAKVYRRPMSAFFLPKPPPVPDLEQDFRLLPGAPTAPSSELLVELRRLDGCRDEMLQFTRELGETPPVFALFAEAGESPVDAATRVRMHFGISGPSPRSRGGAESALRQWRRAIEEHGVLVFQVRGVGVRELRGFSRFWETYPWIVLNVGDSAQGRLFSLLHEFGHLMHRGGAVCDLQDRDDVESWCNRFAEALLPRVARPREVIDGRGGVRRSRRGNVPRRLLEDMGASYVERMFAAHHENLICLSELVGTLEVKVKDLEGIEALLVQHHSASRLVDTP